MPTVIIIGGGITGLTAANHLHKNKIDFLLLERSDRVGGRVKTEVIDGHRFDHGFQVLLTAYPMAKKWLDYEALDLRAFAPGALLLYPDGKKDRIGDPLRDISSLLPTVLSRAGSLTDKFKILSLRNRLKRMSIEEIFDQSEKPTGKVLQEEYGFSTHMIKHFFQPFFAGIFLEKELKTSRRMFDFVFKMFSEANTAIPNLGMEEIPKQLAANLPAESIQCHAEVVRVDGQAVHLKDGSTVHASHIVVATEATSLIKELANIKTTFQSTLHLHYLATQSPIEQPLIALNTLPNRLSNNICAINAVAPGYSKGDKHLISISLVGQPSMNSGELNKLVTKELSQWFGKAVYDWQKVEERTITYALPNQNQVVHQLAKQQRLLRKGLYAAGDFQLNGSINAAMKAGEEVADLVIEEGGL